MTEIGRKCTQCGEWKPQPEFGWKSPEHKRMASRCGTCRRANYKENPQRNRDRARAYHHANREAVLAAQKTRRVTRPEACLLREARARAKARGLSFDLTIDDVAIPERCPVLGLPLRINSGRCGPDSPTIDRLHPHLGYVKGNVMVVSHRANTIKSDATLEELQAVLAFYEPVLAVRERMGVRVQPKQGALA